MLVFRKLSSRSEFKQSPQNDVQDGAAVSDPKIQKTGVISHVPKRIPPTANKKYPQRRCVVCRKNGKPRDARYYCEACIELPALCKTSCFKKYHE